MTNEATFRCPRCGDGVVCLGHPFNKSTSTYLVEMVQHYFMKGGEDQTFSIRMEVRSVQRAKYAVQRSLRAVLGPEAQFTTSFITILEVH